MKIHECAQGSTEWLMLRAGIPTASEFDALVTPKWKVRTGQTPQTYLAKKLAEWWCHGPLLSGGSSFWNADQGHILEQEAIPWFELEYDRPVKRVGFVTTDDGRVGCSPDGLLTIGDSICSGIEVKCPEAPAHVRYLLDGELPEDYAAQVQGSMFVTGFSAWRFLSYRRHFPALVLAVEREEEAQKAIAEALANFLEQFEAGKARLTELNGGPPPPPPPSDDSPNPVYHIDEPESVEVPIP